MLQIGQIVLLTVVLLAWHSSNPVITYSAADTLLADPRPWNSTAGDHAVKSKLIAHKRRQHPQRNRTRSVITVSRRQQFPSGSQQQQRLFSLNFFHDLHVHLGLISETNRTTTTASTSTRAVSRQPPRRPAKQRHPRVQPTPVSGLADELLPMGYPWYANSHVPFRYRYKYSSSYLPATKLQGEDPTVAIIRTVDPCVLSRWNFELPFSELPNMLAKLLASDMISGETTAAKSRYVFELLHLTLDSYQKMDPSGDVFDIPPGTDLGRCNFKKTDDPLYHSVNNLLKLYSDKSTTTERLFALVKAAKACLGKEDQPFPLELLPCLDFSFGSDQVLKLSVHKSIFGNEELCRLYLSPVVSGCVPVDQHPCTAVYIEFLNSFARTFYQCPETTGEKQHSVSMANKAAGDVSTGTGESRSTIRIRLQQWQLLMLTLALTSISSRVS
ncbi:uncharacterized protein LOC129601065 isoform X2 [Paramacrobiotus metropolitanus]|uniref:uncharacterized protein LOC129601065 isoform X2 n=1 Tax=Paramacrobiotus metropolitanus TaxID=2943436 RepID=UPI00244592A6|nr:uncharacterized protein LOC129601065 isoform X2 [Paramacrobiotus metropolitanus]